MTPSTLPDLDNANVGMLIIAFCAGFAQIIEFNRDMPSGCIPIFFIPEEGQYV